MAKNKKEFREELTQQFLSLLENENLNWIKEWSSLDATPINGSSGKQYAGINHFKLLMTMLQHGWSDPRFMTFNQVRKMHKENGTGLCSVIKGSKGFQVEYWFMNDLKKAFGQKGKFLSFQDAKKLIDQGLRETSDFQLTSRYYTVFHPENYKSYSAEIMNLIKKSDNVLYQTKLEYSDKASRDTEVLSKEKRDIMYALNVLNYLVLPVQQEVYMANKETAINDKRLVKGTAIDMFAAVTHFNERYVLPHVHILYMAPQPELSVLYRGFIRQLERDPLMLPVRKEQLNGDIIQ